MKALRMICCVLLCALLCCLFTVAVAAEEKTPLTVTVKEQSFAAGSLPSSTKDDVTVVGLLEGHVVESVVLAIGDHELTLQSIVIKNGDTDVTAQYEITANPGVCHILSYEWAHDENGHYHLCSDNDCTVRADEAAHVYENACDEGCNICGALREASAHVYGEGTVTKEATVREEGNTEYVCSVCGYKHNEPIPATGLPGIAIAGIVVGAVALVGAGMLCLYWFVIRKKKKA